MTIARRQIADRREAAQRAATLAKRRSVSLENLNEALKEGKASTLNLILKGDASGSVEALESSLLDIEVGDEVQLQIIHRGVGAITQNDVNLATVDNAVIIGFNVRPAERVQEMADREGVEMNFYSVIYKAIEDVEAALKGMLKPIYEEVQARFREENSPGVPFPASSATSRAPSSALARSSVERRLVWYATAS